MFLEIRTNTNVKVVNLLIVNGHQLTPPGFKLISETERGVLIPVSLKRGDEHIKVSGVFGGTLNAKVEAQFVLKMFQGGKPVQTIPFKGTFSNGGRSVFICIFTLSSIVRPGGGFQEGRE